MIKNFLLILIATLLLTGCGKNKKTFFGKEGDTLIKSSCETCVGKPFYVNGHWI